MRLPESRSLRQRPAARLTGRVLPGPVNAPWEVTAGPPEYAKALAYRKVAVHRRLFFVQGTDMAYAVTFQAAVKEDLACTRVGHRRT